MCFSISMAKTAEEIAEAFGVFSADIPPLPEYYYVSGFTFPDIPVLYNFKGRKKISLMKWGLVPSWIKNEDDASRIRSKTLNARSETADSLPSFRSSFRTGRCIVITDGFYEPHQRDGKSYPYYVRRKDRGIIPIGGLYAAAVLGDETLFTFSILTVPASLKMAEIHNKKKRMPFVFPAGNPDYDKFLNRWLDPSSAGSELKEMFRYESVKNFLSGTDKNEYDAYPVSKDIYRKGFTDSEDIQNRINYPELTDGLLPF